MSDERPGEMRIGQVLEQARARAGLEIADVEDRTKIRAKYLRALESEDWGELPSPAYAKGFLRTYSQLLGLDSDALVDEYRRQVESDLSEPAYPLGDQVLERRRRPGAGGARRSRAWIFVVLAVLAVAGVAAALVLTNDDEPKRGGKQGAGGKGSERRHEQRGGNGEASAKPVSLELRIREPVEVCLLGGAGGALIDGQVLPAGDRESFERKELTLRFPSGFAGDQLTVKIGGDKRLLPKADGPAAYRITGPQRVRVLEPPGQSCP